MLNANLNTLPPELKNKLFTDTDRNSHKALGTTNKKWNQLFLQILQKDPYVQSVKQHVNKFTLRPAFVDDLLKTTTIESVNKLNCWILANDILSIRHSIASTIHQTFQSILISDEPRYAELKEYAQIVCSDPLFVSNLAVNPATLTSLTDFCGHAKEREAEDPLKKFLKIMAPHIKQIDITHLHISTLPEEFNFLSSLTSFLYKPNSLEIKFI